MRHVNVIVIAAGWKRAGFILAVNLWAADDAHRDTCMFKTVSAPPTAKQIRRFYKASRPYWRRGARR